MNTGKTLATEYKNILTRLNTQAKDDTPDNAPEKKAAQEMLDELFGVARPETFPTELSDEMLRDKTGVPLHLWENNELYPAIKKGKLRAAHIIQSHLQTVERAYSIQRRNARKNKQPKTLTGKRKGK